jgi:protein phosphatase 1 regulatory subunit 37
VMISVPGKSILKKPPPQQPSLFSRITRLLPSQSSTQPQTNEDEKPLKRAHFILPQIATVYPISSLNPPSTPTLKDEKRAIEDQEAERRKKIVRGSPNCVPGLEPEEWWSMDKVDAFYRECCLGCEEEPIPAISAAFKVPSSIPIYFYTSHPLPARIDNTSEDSGFVWCATERHQRMHTFRCFHHRMGFEETSLSRM